MAADEEDLKIISACLQDAVMKVGDFAWIPGGRRFAFVANRFLWEQAGAAAPYYRTRAGAHFDDVRAVKQVNIRNDAKDAVVELLALRFAAGADGGGAVEFAFSGGGAIRLEVDAINAELRDISDPWPTRTKPAHKE
jgi:hypothetical protein